jgi:hypothetical protein
MCFLNIKKNKYIMSSTFVLYSRPFLNRNNYDQSYSNIVTINVEPKGPLRRFVRRVRFERLSEFKEPNCNQCGLALQSFIRGERLMITDEVPDLFSFLLSNGYKIDTSLTKMMNTSDIRFHTDNANKIICFVTYIG